MPLGAAFMAATDIDALQELREAIVAAECSGDLTLFAESLDDDAVVMPPDAPAREGKAACLSFVRDVLGSLLSQFERELVCESAEIVVAGGYAFDRGSFFQVLREKGSGLVVRERGHYLWLYVRRPAGWKLSRVIWNGGEEVQDLAFDGEAGEEERIQ
jgi:ketosteroid isomerase-like protein